MGFSDRQVRALANDTSIAAMDGRWFVTGPWEMDGTGWDLCEQDPKDPGACIQCWAHIQLRSMAMRIFDAMVNHDLTNPEPWMRRL